MEDQKDRFDKAKQHRKTVLMKAMARQKSRVRSIESKRLEVQRRFEDHMRRVHRFQQQQIREVGLWVGVR
eukprot:609137-Amorphochlora_amoeboformis.AAC.1